MNPYPGLGRALLLLAAALLAQAGAGQGLAALWPSFPPLLIAGLANLVSLSAVAAFGFWRSGEGPRWLPSTPVPAALATGVVLTAAGGTIVLGELSNVTTALVPLPPALVSLFNTLGSAPLALSLFTLVFVAPLTEELLFRGLLLRGFVRRWGVAPGLVLSSALFALFHLNIWQAVPAFVAGLFLGWLALRTASLLVPLLFHALFNGLPVVLSAAGVVVEGYNSPLVEGVVEFQPLWWLALGVVLVAAGLVLSKPWAPLSGAGVSDTVVP